MKQYINVGIGLFKLIITKLLVCTVFRGLYKQNIWIIREKETEARDNGYHLFKYIRENHPEIRTYYVITKNSVDLHKVESLGNIIWYNSMKHCLYYLASSYNINSQPCGAYPFDARLIGKLPRFLKPKGKIVFLQHGIIKDELHHGLDYNNVPYDIFVTSAVREQEFVINTYHYPRENVKLLGLCRFDKLEEKKNEEHNQILVMPTYRGWLKSEYEGKTATSQEKVRFLKSDFYQTYMSLLNNPRLGEILEQNNLNLIFYPHYSLQGYIDIFKDNFHGSSRIQIADRYHYDVQTLLIESKMLITDFSSIFFDFAYMDKPELFYQYDEEKYRKYHYKKGYFSYEDDGFGPVVKNENLLVSEIEKIIRSDFKITDKYQLRIDKFFKFHDSCNCERTYEAIENLRR